MKVIFLDVDGVLNSDDFFKITPTPMVGLEGNIDLNKIMLLKRAKEETNSSVVLSSSWRCTKLGAKLKQLLLKYGMVVDSTPYINNERGIEIKKYLREHPGITDYVILDDEIFDSYDEILMQHLIKISNGNGRNIGEGLLEKDVEEIINRLGRVSKKEEVER